MLKFSFTVFMLFLSLLSICQLTIRVTSIPNATPEMDKIYIAGTMNNWNPGAAAYVLTKDNDGILSITFTPSVGTVKFKFTRGSWDKVEGTSQGNFIPDRTETYNGVAKTINLTIAGWEGTNSQVSTASPQVSILSDTFYIPQLNRKRRVWIYLPKDYTTSSKTYPVLYMHDGQNVFDRLTSFAGEWGVDEALDSLYALGDPGCIVVAIDNGGGNRLNEYSPWVNPQYGGGQGDLYVDFIVQTLKPYVDQRYRTLTDAANTGIMGSSMGGLISMYAGVKYPDIFGRVGALSSSYWFSPMSYEYVSSSVIDNSSYFYMIAGEKEGSTQVSDMNKMSITLHTAGATPSQVFAESHVDGQHSEWYWKREFPKAYKWLFEKKTSSQNDDIKNEASTIYQSGAYLIFDHIVSNQSVTIFDVMGNVIFKTEEMKNKILDLGSVNYRAGIHFVTIGRSCQKIFIK